MGKKSDFNSGVFSGLPAGTHSNNKSEYPSFYSALSRTEKFVLGSSLITSGALRYARGPNPASAGLGFIFVIGISRAIDAANTQFNNDIPRNDDEKLIDRMESSGLGFS